MVRAILVFLATLWLSTLALAAPAAPEAPMVYRYPPPESGADRRMDYYWDILRLALNATTPKWGPYVAMPSDLIMNADRAQAMLSGSRDISILVRTTSIEREMVLYPILIPLDKGLTGYRLFLINKSTQKALNDVKSLDDLKAYSIGQGSNWVDVIILRSAGLKVVPGGGYESLFKMLAAGRFDLFSRGLTEIRKEFDDGYAANNDLAIENTLLLYYPLPRYFFFARTDEGLRLAKRVEEGLQMIIKDGQFDRQYTAFKRQILADLHLGGRKLFRIDNPLLSRHTPLHNRAYWDALSDELECTLSPPREALTTGNPAPGANAPPCDPRCAASPTQTAPRGRC